MFKRIIATLSALTVLLTMSGCKYDSLDNAEMQDLPSLPDYSQYIELGEYKNIEYTLLNEYGVTDEYIQFGIDTLLYNVASYKKVTDRAIKIGDLVTIKYEGFVDGKAINGSKSSNDGEAVFVGYSGLIEGFEENLIGLKEGDVTSIKVTLPNDYGNIKLRGKEAVFTVEVSNIQERVLPEITDELIAENTEYASIEEITNAVKQTLEVNELYRKNSEIYGTVSKKIIDNSVIKGYPEDILNNLVETSVENVKTTASLNGMSVENYIKDIYDYDSLDEYRTATTNSVKEFLALRMVMCEIARKENITATVEEFNDYKVQYAKENGYMNIEDVNIHYADEEILLDSSLIRIEDWIIENSVEKE